VSTGTASPAERVIIDASVMVDLVARTSDRFSAVRARLAHTVMHAPAHLDAEVLSALGRMQRAGVLTVGQVDAALADLRQAPVTRHALAPLSRGGWARRATLRLADALYVELADTTSLLLLTTDQRLARAWPSADSIA
jgi:predicted nucleic acid-binding protein